MEINTGSLSDISEELKILCSRTEALLTEYHEISRELTAFYDPEKIPAILEETQNAFAVCSDQLMQYQMIIESMAETFLSAEKSVTDSLDGFVFTRKTAFPKETRLAPLPDILLDSFS